MIFRTPNRIEERALIRTFAFLILVLPASSGASAQDTVAEREQAVVEKLMIKGLTSLYLDDHAGAGRAFEEALKIRSDDPALLASLGQVKLELGDFVSAEFFLSRALTLEPDNPLLWRLATELYAASGQLSELIAAHERLVVVSPDELGPRRSLIALFMRTEDYAQALTSAEEAIARLGPMIELLQLQADVLQRLGRHAELEETLLTLIDADPDERSHRLRLVASRVGREDWEGAESVLRGMLRFDPDDIEAAGSLIDVLQHAGRTEEAIRVENEYRPKEGGNPAGYPTVGARNSTDSIDGLASWLEQHPNDVDARFSLAGKLREAARFLEAADQYQQVVQADPKRLEAWSSGIDAFISAGEPARAMQLVDVALSLFPGYVPVGVLHLKALYAAERFQEALSVARELASKELSDEERGTVESIIREIDAM